MKRNKPPSESQTKVFLSRLAKSKVEYPAPLLANRRKTLLGLVPAAGLLIGNPAVLGRILQGIRSTSSLVTKAILLPALGVIGVGTILLVGYSQGWFQADHDEVQPTETATLRSQVVATLTATSMVDRATQTKSPTTTATLMSTLPTAEATDVIPTPAPSIPPTLVPNSGPNPTATVPPTLTASPESTATPDDGHGKHLGQTPTPPAKRTETP